MKAKKFEKYIQKSNEIALELNDIMEEVGVTNPFMKRKKFEREVYWFAGQDADFHEELVRLAIRTLFIAHKARLHGCCGHCCEEE